MNKLYAMDDEKWDFGDVYSYTLEFIDEMVNDRRSRHTRFDVLHILLYCVADEVIEHSNRGDNEAYIRVADAVNEAIELMNILPAKRHWRRKVCMAS
jgi:rRNA pseudouridine-1189 N-methylase Emg1 (Nep1/Mra1 family)